MVEETSDRTPPAAETPASVMQPDSTTLAALMTRPTRWIPVVLALAALFTYRNSFHGPFIFDDIRSIPENRHIRTLWPPSVPLTAEPGTTLGGRPIVSLTLALNYAFGKLDVTGYHAVNLLIHALVALALFGLVRLTLTSPACKERYEREAHWLAGAVALLFVVHPLTTDAVDYVVQRGELLVALFLLLALYCSRRAFDGPSASRWTAAAIAACALGMGCKPVMVVAPILVILYDRAYLFGSFAEAASRRKRLYAGLAATWLLGVPMGILHGRGYSAGGLTPWQYLLTQCGVVVHYLRLAFWPHPLVVDYDDWPIARSMGPALPFAALLVAMAAASVWAWRRRPALGFLGASFFLILAPTSSVLPLYNEIAAERRMYLPLAAILTLVVLAAHSVSRRLSLPDERRAAIGGGLLVVVAGTLSIVSTRRNEDYRSALSIWQDAVAKRPANSRAHQWVARELGLRGKESEAIAEYEQAVRLKPGDAAARRNLAGALARRGLTAESLAQLDEAAKIEPESADAQVVRGVALYAQGRLDEAAAAYAEALRLEPRHATAHLDMAVVLARQGKRQQAREHLLAALESKPDFVEARTELGGLLLAEGRADEALSHLAAAVEIDPSSATARHNLGVALAKAGRGEQALEQFRAAVRLNPDAGDSHNNLGVLLASQGRIDEAIVHFSAALRVQPTNANARANLERALAIKKGGG